jgi:hypothetical protein
MLGSGQKLAYSLLCFIHQTKYRSLQAVKKNREHPQTYHVCTLPSGTTGNTNFKIVSSEVTYNNNVITNKFRQQKITMIGDKFP